MTTSKSEADTLRNKSQLTAYTLILAEGAVVSELISGGQFTKVMKQRIFSKRARNQIDA
jgi:hypothetical protein